ncbi:type II secretion system protein [Candidatus Saccharibacteria bacterium]|nr:MAG: type II secretion system protein [Candidatus Saccharibacteria bacterium]
MLKPQKLKDQKGFTIIEVLIVLAIAGLILLIVFLAVPALQRNSRNTARKNDVSNILGGLSEYTNNQNGTLPASCTVGNCGTAQWLTNAKVGTIDTAQVAFTNRTTAGTVTAPTALDAVSLANFSVCDSTGTASTASNASKRSVVAVYLVETGSGTQAQCVASGS